MKRLIILMLVFAMSIELVNAPPATTTIQVSKPLEDLWLTDTIGGDDAEAALIKFNITAIPAGTNITNATFCGYINITLATDGTGTTGVIVTTTTNQTWNEANTAAQLQLITYVNSTTQAFTSITANTWTCTDVTLQLNTSYRLGQQNATFRFQATARTFTSIDVATDNSGLRIGDTDDYIALNDRENTLASGNYAYINITYKNITTTSPVVSNATLRIISTIRTIPLVGGKSWIIKTS
jgi:hypothetical protein